MKLPKIQIGTVFCKKKFTFLSKAQMQLEISKITKCSETNRLIDANCKWGDDADYLRTFLYYVRRSIAQGFRKIFKLKLA